MSEHCKGTDTYDLKTAMVFAHPAHELFMLGSILAWDPHLFYLSRGYREGIEGEESLRRLLASVGFQGTLTIYDVSESEIFRRYLQHDYQWFVSLRNVLADWIQRVQPQAVFSDAFEHYNSAHDLCPLLVDSALRRLGPHQAPPKRFEIPLATHSLGESEALAYFKSESGFVCKELSKDLLHRKKSAWSLAINEATQLGQHFTDGPADVTSTWTDTRHAYEFYRSVTMERSYAILPSGIRWQNYDQRGSERVRCGRSKRAITFVEHFLPLVRFLAHDGSNHGRGSRSSGCEVARIGKSG